MAKLVHREGADIKQIRVGREQREAIAEVVSRKPQFRAYAAKIFAEIKAEAAKHIDSGLLESSIHLHQEKVDYHIETTGVNYSWHTEFGHFVGPRGSSGRKWVKGIGVFRKVVARHGGY